MIFNILIDMIAGAFTGLDKLVPDIPALPAEITSIGTTLTNSIASGYGVIAGFFGTGFLIAILTMVIAIINFTHIYHLVLWVIRKLPVGTN